MSVLHGRIQLLDPAPRKDIRYPIGSFFRSLAHDQEEHAITVVLCGTGTNGRKAINWAYQLRPDIVIMEVVVPLIDGDEATRQIKAHMPQTRVVALSMDEKAQTVERMRRAGAESYVLKNASSEELLAAIRGHS